MPALTIGSAVEKVQYATFRVPYAPPLEDLDRLIEFFGGVGLSYRFPDLDFVRRTYDDDPAGI